MIDAFVSARGPRAVSNQNFSAEHAGQFLEEEISNRSRVVSLASNRDHLDPPASGNTPTTLQCPPVIGRVLRCADRESIGPERVLAAPETRSIICPMSRQARFLPAPPIPRDAMAPARIDLRPPPRSRYPGHNPLGDTRQAEADIHAPQRGRPRGPPRPRRSSAGTGRSSSATIHCTAQSRRVPAGDPDRAPLSLAPPTALRRITSPRTRAIHHSDRRGRARTTRQEFHDSRSSSPRPGVPVAQPRCPSGTECKGDAVGRSTPRLKISPCSMRRSAQTGKLSHRDSERAYRECTGNVIGAEADRSFAVSDRPQH